MNKFAHAAAAAVIALALAGPSWAASPAPQKPSPAPSTKTGQMPEASFEDVSRFISGLPSEAPFLKKLQDTKEWQEFAAAMDKSWADLETKRLKPMRAWAAEELGDMREATKLLFYPFGGPDFLTAFEIYPGASTYVLLGLEFVGRLPDFHKTTIPHMANYVHNLTASLWDFFNKSYFITNHMNAELAGDKVDGILPVLCFFLTRTGNVITSIQRCEFLDNGEIMEMDFFTKRKKTFRPYGVKIEFLAETAPKEKTLYYFSTDLSDGAFTPKSKFSLYAHALPFETTFLKSAQYCMHYAFFTNIRNLILEKSRFVLEDDTGIPYHYFKPAAWDGQLFGEYIKPIADFKGVEQPDLKAAYADPAKVKKLPFHLGYHWSTNKDSILYFRKRTLPEGAGTR